MERKRPITKYALGKVSALPSQQSKRRKNFGINFPQKLKIQLYLKLVNITFSGNNPNTHLYF